MGGEVKRNAHVTRGAFFTVRRGSSTLAAVMNGSFARTLGRICGLLALAGCGGGGGEPPDPCLPPCLAALETPCLPAGTCVGDTTNMNFCYSNGVKDLTTVDPTTDLQTTVRTTTDGVTACFSEILAPSTLTGHGTLTWRDASGNPVASATFETQSDTLITCQDTGKTYRCPYGMPFDVPTPSCTASGTCQ
jgi:hypothetical protein